MAEATIRDVARYAGVGVGTVSRVLNNSPSVADTTRSKVLSAIEILNYSPNQTARRLSSGKTMAIGVLVPFFTNASVVRRLQGIVEVLADSDYDLVLFDVEKTQNRDKLLTNIASRKMVDGLLILSLRPHDRDMQRFLQAELPAVLVDANHPQLSRIVVDNVWGAETAVNHLIDLGHTRIAYISDYRENPFNFSPTSDRYAGYCHALQAAAIPYNPNYYREGALDREEARHLAHDLLTLREPPTAIFAYSDTQAIGVLQAAQDLDLQIPQDLAVIGYDDIETAVYLDLTTIRQSLYESGVKGAQLLLEIMQTPLTEPVEIKLPTELIVRKTTMTSEVIYTA
ncbi:MAG: LacI family DNA-binding transcriptional regulator [Anaerolineales bacterium]|nr:LacI family DNA-binding transcriptional regulator [Anaerolineales bacterium]